MAFTKERLTALSNRENVGAILAEEIAELARIALASLEAEPVAYVMADDLKDSSIISTPAYRDLGEARERTVGDVVALYTVPPAPVSVKIPPEKPHTDGLLADGWNACRAAMLQGAEPVTTACKLPMQPLSIDAHGTLRFKENPIVRKLLDYATEHGYGLNEIALDEFEAEYQMQLAQLIGYSLSGYGTLSYVTDESYDRAAAAAPQHEVK